MKAVFPAFDGFALTSTEAHAEGVDAKRVLDVAASLLLIVFLSPLLALVKDPRGEVYLLGMPKRPPNAVTMYSSRPMARLVHILRGGADFVVIDCDPAGAGPEAALIARLADATVLVSNRKVLHSPLIANAARILEGAHAAPIGIVVTK